MSMQELIIIGNCTEPELRYTPAGVAVCSFGVAVNKRWKDKNGEQQEKTTWFRVSAWREQADYLAKWLTKGRLVCVVGELEEPRVYQTKSGDWRASLDVTARPFGVHMLGSSDSSPDQISSDVGKLAEQEAIPF